MNNRPIGVFDSGIGGLTVVKNLMELLPNENIIYFGDIARIPYGTKSRATIQRFAEQTVKFLLDQEVKAIIIACNTISAVAKETVQNLAKDIPVIDVISAGAKAAESYNHIGVIATQATVNSKAYSRAIHEHNKEAIVDSQECGLFVPMIEEGFVKGIAIEAVASEYLSFFKDKDIEALILGCTHYPLISDIIAKFIKQDTLLIDPATQACLMLKECLEERDLLNVTNQKSDYRFYVTDIPIKFKAMGEMFLKTQMDYLEIVSLEN